MVLFERTAAGNHSVRGRKQHQRDCPAVCILKFLGAFGDGHALESPRPLGQKRNYLERNVETHSDWINKSHSHAGTRPPFGADSVV